MMLPSCPCALRCIQKKNPIRSSTGSRIGKNDVKKLGLGVSNSSLVCSPIRSWSASGRGMGPVVLNSPSSVVKSMPPSLLSYLASCTSPSATVSKKLEYVTCSLESLPVK